MAENRMFGPLISPHDLSRHFGGAGWVLFDCRFDLADTERGRREFDLGHIPGARYAHVGNDLSDPSTPRSWSEWSRDPSSPVATGSDWAQEAEEWVLA